MPGLGLRLRSGRGVWVVRARWETFRGAPRQRFQGYNVILRLYGPLEPWFNETWQPGDLELQM